MRVRQVTALEELILNDKKIDLYTDQRNQRFEPEMTERITEDIVREHFKNDNMFSNIKLEEQRPKNERLKDLLKIASKKGTGKAGSPEFIITIPSIMDLVMIVECKLDLKNHDSSERDEKPNPEKYAVDGVLHYAKFLKNDFNVIAIAVSGQSKDRLKVSNFLIKKGGVKKEIESKLLSIYDYLSLIETENNVEKLKHENILLTATKLNDKLYGHSIPEGERATIVSGILIALQDAGFKKSYSIYTEPADLVTELLLAINRVLVKNKMGDKIPTLMDEYSKIKNSIKLAKEPKIRDPETGNDEDNTILRELIHEIETKIFPYTKYKNIGYDILGQFYSEFIRYANGDEKLGLVLTPQHVAELFIDIARLNKDDILYDNCCGTAVFLIKGMARLLKLAEHDEAKKIHIKTNQLFGLETRSDMFTYACSNMMMRGDGKSNIFQWDSLSKKNKEYIKKQNPTVGLLNPPYSTGVPELEFVYNNLECLIVGGRCIAVIPFNSVLADSGDNYEWRKKLLKEHTLEAVFSMPLELFNPSGAVTAIVVFTAHKPHQQDHETYFGYWRDDGYEKQKPIGRIDKYGKWETIKRDWLYNYRNRKEVNGHSVMKHVSENDEWCAEAYLKTDYSGLKDKDFEDEIKKFLSYKVRYV